MKQHLEHEIKLDADPAFALPDLTGVVAGAEVMSRPPEHYETIYYDTRDVRLARWGVSVRCRTGEPDLPEGLGRWTVKLPQDAPRAALVRREIVIDAPTRTVPDEVVALVRAYVRLSLLAPVAVLRSERRRHVVHVAGCDIAEVDDDTVSIVEEGAVVARFREIEVERKDDGDVASTMKMIVRALEAAGAARGNGTSKVERALGAELLGTPEIDIPEVNPDSPMGAVARAAIASSVVRLLRHDPGVRLGDDPEDVHQARVATRRLRSDLRTFAHVLDEQATDHIRDGLGWLAGVLGTVRDADVLLERLQDHAKRLPASEARGAAGVLRKLEAERDEARSELLALMNDDRYLGLIEELVRFARRPPLLSTADDRAADVLAGVVRRQWKRLHRQVRALDAEPADQALHEVRIRAKRARYAAEATVGVCGKRAARLGRSLAGLQGVLGDLNDAVVAEAWLRRTATRASAAQAFAAGQLVCAEREARAQARAQWSEVWRSVREVRRQWPS